MLRGMTTVSYYADDLAAAKRWYSELLGTTPYFEAPGYIEFRIGDYRHELGIIDRRYCPDSARETGGALLYWHVDDLDAAMNRLRELGAAEHQPVTERGPGFVTASVVDPFGNLLGIMSNQHYLDVLDERRAS
ncbi:VOC family protein [Nocardia africana]|uniref:Predicted enzyme related to lactoylglutathione lyase n=1 Tax=Nocardia africana TaxID=134964 RepID=A0A378X1T9_9NOCA|nr:VOC family protein [Nocardia africana]MCC3311742.1 VOC family protein [Nocardia africana]SUA46987.1 Predicted enzyme related to lactoylglutathione lyase [Nocardia africana]